MQYLMRGINAQNTTKAYPRVPDISSVKEVQKVEDSEPRHDVPVDFAHELALVHIGSIHLRSVRLGFDDRGGLRLLRHALDES